MADIYDKLGGALNDLEKNPVEKEIKAIVKKHKEIIDDIGGEISKLRQKPSIPNRLLQEDLKKLQKRADKKLVELAKSTENFARIAAPKSELSGRKLADHFIKRQSKVVDKDGEVTKLFDVLPKDKEQIKKMTEEVTEEMLRDVKMINKNLRKNFDDTVRDGINQVSSLNFNKAAAGKKEGIGRRLYNQIADEGLKLVDKAGRKWSPDRYVKMFARTRSRELQTQGLKNRMKDYEFDLVKVSDHLDVDGMDICNGYEQNVYSLSGDHPRYPYLDQEPPFHPNCAHVITPWIEKYHKEVNKNPTVEQVNPEYRELHPELSDDALRRLEQEHNNVLEHGLKTGNEELVLINKGDGSLAFRRVPGTENSVSLPDDMVSTLRNADKESIIMIHNHPGSSSFSDADLRVMNNFSSIDSMTVQGHNGTMYRCSQAGAKSVPGSWITDDYNDFKKGLQGKYANRVFDDGLSQNRAWQEHTDEVVSKLADRYNWKYKRVKSKGE